MATLSKHQNLTGFARGILLFSALSWAAGCGPSESPPESPLADSGVLTQADTAIEDADRGGEDPVADADVALPPSDAGEDTRRAPSGDTGTADGVSDGESDVGEHSADDTQVPPPVQVNPSLEGPVAFSIDEVTAGPQADVPVRVYVPEAEPVAVALFLPGFQLRSEWYSPLHEHLASHGIAVVAADPPTSLFSVNHNTMVAQAVEALDAVLGMGGPLETSTAPIFATGHSLGGKLSVMVADADDRIDGVFAIDPVNGAGPLGYSDTLPNIVPDSVAGLAMPLGFVGETLDSTTPNAFGQACAPADQNYATFADAASAASTVYQWTIHGAGHMDFVADVSACGFTCSLCNPSSADPGTTQASVQTLATAFIRRHAVSDTAMDTWLVGSDLPNGVDVHTR